MQSPKSARPQAESSIFRRCRWTTMRPPSPTTRCRRRRSICCGFSSRRCWTAATPHSPTACSGHSVASPRTSWTSPVTSRRQVGGASAQRRNDLALEQLDARTVIGGLGEVEDRVLAPKVAHTGQPLDDLLGRAAGRGRRRGVRGHRINYLRVCLGGLPRADPLDAVCHFRFRRTDDRIEVRRSHDGAVIGADRGAVPLEHLGLVLETLWLRGEVRILRVLRGNLQRDLLAAARNPERNAVLLQRLWRDDRAIDLEVLAGEADPPVTPGVAHDL